MIRILIPFFSLLAVSASAQLRNPIYTNWDAGYAVGTYGRYQASSNALTSNLVWNTYQGKFLERDLREKVSGMHTESNRLGADMDYGLFARHLPDSTKGIGWFVGIADRTHVNGKYPRDLFDVLMFGNAQFAGETIQLAPIQFNFLSYTQVEAGILKTIRKDKGSWNIGFGLSALFGKQNINVVIDKAEMYTDPDGEYLEGSIHGTVRTASISSTQYFDANGMGFSGSLNVGYSTSKWGIKFEADDLGLISWSQNVNQTDLDSTFRFEGADVNLFATDGNAFSSINLDSVVNGFATDVSIDRYITSVPGRMRLEGHYMLNDKKLRLYAGVQYRIAPGYIPYAYIGTDSPLGKGFFIDGRFAYGGFGSWNLGLEVKKRFGEAFEVRIGTNNLEGYVLPMVGTSQSAYLSLAGFF